LTKIMANPSDFTAEVKLLQGRRDVGRIIVKTLFQHIEMTIKNGENQLEFELGEEVNQEEEESQQGKGQKFF